jgi:hypothetical protein
MANNRSALGRGPGYLTVGSSSTPSTTANLIQFADDAAINFRQDNEDLVVSTQGAIDKTRTDAAVELSGTPIAYSPSQTTLMALLFAQCSALPLIGASLCGASDTPGIFIATNNDAVAIYNLCCPKPPNLTLDINKPLIDKINLVGLIRNNFDPETASSYYTLVTGKTYSPPVLLQSGDLIGRQRYYGNWSAGNTATGNSTFTNFQGQKGVVISFEADWQPIKVQGRTLDYTLGPKGLRAMAKLIPVGPSTSDILTCQQLQSAHGSRLSANAGMGDCIFTGQNGSTSYGRPTISYITPATSSTWIYSGGSGTMRQANDFGGHFTVTNGAGSGTITAGTLMFNITPQYPFGSNVVLGIKQTGTNSMWGEQTTGNAINNTCGVSNNVSAAGLVTNFSVTVFGSQTALSTGEITGIDFWVTGGCGN